MVASGGPNRVSGPQDRLDHAVGPAVEAVVERGRIRQRAVVGDDLPGPRPPGHQVLLRALGWRSRWTIARPSQDLDFATSSNVPLPEVAAQVQEAFAALGYAVRIDEAGVRSARLHLRLPEWQDELEVDLLKEALEPRWLTVEVGAAAHLQAVSLDDAVGMKARAWHDRFVPRDIIDLHAVAATGSFSCVDIESLGRRHAPELDLEVLLEHLSGVGAWADRAFQAYGLDEQAISDLRRWVTEWYDDLNQRLATEDYGTPADDQEDPGT
jgi:hypothetical protein